MEKNKLIKTRLYFMAIALLLTVMCIVVYTSMRSKDSSDSRSADPLQGQVKSAEDQSDDLWQVSSTPSPEMAQQSQHSAEKKIERQDALQEDGTYHLVVHNGYLQVYLVQTGKLYMETAIVYDLLPERVQKQIDEGKYFESEEALLEFLENYSS